MSIQTLQAWQSVCYVFIFIGAVLAAGGALGNNHLGKKIASLKEQAAIERENELISELQKHDENVADSFKKSRKSMFLMEVRKRLDKQRKISKPQRRGITRRKQ